MTRSELQRPAVRVTHWLTHDGNQRWRWLSKLFISPPPHMVPKCDNSRRELFTGRVEDSNSYGAFELVVTFAL